MSRSLKARRSHWRLRGSRRGGVFGLSYPEVAFWKRDRLEGYTRLYVNVFEARSDRLVRSIGPFEGSAFLKSYTAFFFIRWQETDMDKPLEDP